MKKENYSPFHSLSSSVFLSLASLFHPLVSVINLLGNSFHCNLILFISLLRSFYVPRIFQQTSSTVHWLVFFSSVFERANLTYSMLLGFLLQCCIFCFCFLEQHVRHIIYRLEMILTIFLVYFSVFCDFFLLDIHTFYKITLRHHLAYSSSSLHALQFKSQ